MKKILFIFGLLLSFAFLYAQNGTQFFGATNGNSVEQTGIVKKVSETNNFLKNVSPEERALVQQAAPKTITTPMCQAQSNGGGTRAVVLNESFTNGTLPAGWLNLDVDGDGYAWQFELYGSTAPFPPMPSAGRTDAYSINSASYYNGIGDLYPDNWLITPPLELLGLTELSWWVKVMDADYSYDHYGVYVSTTGTNPSDFTLLFEETLTSAEYAWSQRTIEIPQTGTCYIAFRHFDSNDVYILCIDDIEVSTIAGSYCDVVSNLNAVANDNDVTLTWTAPAETPTGYDIFFNGDLLTHVTTTSYNHTNVPDGVHNYCIEATFSDECAPKSVCTSLSVGTFCNMKVVMHDSFGDGWNGNSLAVKSNGVTLATITLPGGAYGEESIMVPVGGLIDIVWLAGGSYADECSFDIYNGLDDLLYASPTMGSAAVGELMFSFTQECPCALPVTDLKVAYTEDCEAVLTWLNSNLLWDNSDINYETSGLISTYWSGNDNWVIVADDFDATGAWTIERIISKGFPSATSATPTKMAVSIYQDDDNKPGTEIYKNVAIPVASASDPVIVLPTPFTLPGAGKYWISIAGAFDVSVPPSTLGSYRWNITYGAGKIGSNYHLHDPSNQFGAGTAWMDASGLVGGSYSMYFKIEGNPNDGTPIPPHNIYRDGELIASNVTALTFTDDDFDALEPHEWQVATACDNGEESARKSVSAKQCDRGGCDDFIAGTGSAAGYYMPINTYYRYSYVQHLYERSEIGYPDAGEIKSISFQYIHTVADIKDPVTIYLGNTTKTEFATTTDWIPVEDMQQVFYGSISLNNSNPWLTIEFDEPFVFTGCNLVVAILNNNDGYLGSSNTFRYTVLTPSTNYKTLRYAKDSTPAGDLTPATVDYIGTRDVNRSNTMFEVCPVIAIDEVVDMVAKSITGPVVVLAGATENYTVTVSNIGTVTAETFVVKVLNETNDILGEVTVTEPLALCNSAEVTIPVTFGTSNVKIRAVVEIEDDENLDNNESPFFKVDVMPDFDLEDFTVASGTISTPSGTSSEQIPFCFYYNSGAVQSIYLESELDIVPGNTIYMISYNYVATTALPEPKPVKVWITHCEQNTLTSWMPLTAFTQVYEGTVLIPTGAYELQLILDQPFEYHGGNLCIMTEREMAGPYTSGVIAQRFAATGRTRTYYSDQTPFNFASPQSTNALGYVPVTNFYRLPEYTLDATFNAEEATVVMNPTTVIHGNNATLTFGVTDNCYKITDVIINGTSYGAITSHSLTNVTANVVVEVISAPHEYDIVATAGANGTISPIGTTTLCYLESQMYFLIADPGYTVSQLLIDGVSVAIPSNNRYTFSMISANHTIEVTFEPCQTFNLSFQIEGHGVVIYDNVEYSSNGTLSPCIGTNTELEFVPDFGWEIQAVYIDGVMNMLASGSGYYMFVNLQQDHIIRVVFKPIDYIIVASAGDNGTISPSGTVLAPYLSNQQFTFIPNQGYVIDQIFVDNDPIAEMPFYTFENISANHTIHVTFKLATMIIHVSWDVEGCFVDPVENMYDPLTYTSLGGNVNVPYNGIQVLAFVPAEGYKVSMVYVNNIPYPNAILTGSYTFYYQTDEQYLHVTFEKYTYPIISHINGNGMISPEGTVNVAHGEQQTYTFYAMQGYKIVNVFVDGYNNDSAIENSSYTFNDVVGPHTINVITAPLSYKIIAMAGEGGFITPSGEITVTYGGNQYFDIAVASGYEIDKVLVDGIETVEAAQNGAYAFLNVQENHEIYVFCKLMRFKIAAFAEPNGVIEPAGITEINYGEEITYTITPDQDYKISSVLVNGINLGAIETYTFEAIDADGTIEVFFAPNEGNGEVGINDTNLAIGIYSNMNVVYIVNEKNLPINNVSIFDMYGRVIWQGQPQNNQIVLDVANGIYTVRVNANENFTTTKVNIQR